MPVSGVSQAAVYQPPNALSSSVKPSSNKIAPDGDPPAVEAAESASAKMAEKLNPGGVNKLV